MCQADTVSLIRDLCVGYVSGQKERSGLHAPTIANTDPRSSDASIDSYLTIQPEQTSSQVLQVLEVLQIKGQKRWKVLLGAGNMLCRRSRDCIEGNR